MGKRPLFRAWIGRTGVRERRSCRGNGSEPRAPVRLRCAFFSVELSWLRVGRARPDEEVFPLAARPISR